MKILIVEDDREIAYAASVLFRLSYPDAELFSTHLGRSAIELARTHLPDIVILDLGLPDMDGLEVLRQIRTFSKMPVIIASIRTEQSVLEKSVQLGADGYMEKPFHQQDLLDVVKAHL